MITHLLDSNSCIEFLRRGPASPVASRLATMPPGSVGLCSIVVAELLYGAYRSRAPARTLGGVLRFCVRFPSLSFDDSAAEYAAAIRSDLAARGRPIGPNDLLIAAIALAGGLTLVTHNVGEFGRVTGLAVEDWQAGP